MEYDCTPNGRLGSLAEEREEWTTEELQRDFEVLGFGYGLCVVRRKSDGVKGSLDFTHAPRVYFNFVPAS